ncbi:cdc42 effector protein 1 [Dunckerocampus dactyliophorus]|uniref:cdc42 effector protein 1 n=1 Tax=Dunckerocampus dactyliophorus TaxID=161453 RepID=UPI0024068FBD|nr:cdc42 effector protein 1 [Dunckerocampus dactyliophorus]XP_054623958.1 cdc42 effector protein 1 [Dunckerocampus dactyliophorus]XP_054623959.1 cdc42 effector protein 1 [Dunckerocampus dactyliophorus]XP_054623960.1 cdc42 effector protein 1 [Dunckerocampus dactyliophorus]XP_054623961.1 cdc42 effector protein 1 [Dunckerocampus dactyliophorus]
MNLQEKLSGLKGLVTHSHSKRRFKGDLTVDMISPPLGDFRHTMHVGRGGDVFGDTSFLSNHGGAANGGNGEMNSMSTPDNKLGAFFSRKLQQIRRGSDNRPREVTKDASLPPPPISPIIKNAVSLPRLDVDIYNGSPTTKVLFPSSQSTPGERKSSYGLESGFVTLPRLSRSERQQPSISSPTPYSSNEYRGSLTDPTDGILSTCSTTDPKSTVYSASLASLASLDTFNFDLGPSLMSEVFGLLDGHPDGDGPAWEREDMGSAWGLTNEGSEMDSATISYVDSLLREDCAGGKSPHAAEWDDDNVEVNGTVMCGRLADTPRGGSPERARPGVRMESERFQSAADVLARHYGGQGLWKGHGRMEAADSELRGAGQLKKKVTSSYTDDEDDEIKV